MEKKDNAGRLQKYGVRYKNDMPYKSMSDEEIIKFPIDNFADIETCLFMWTIYSKFKLSLDIIDTWKFKFNSIITWYKHDGPCFKGIYRNTELCLFTYRGKMNLSNKHPLKLHVDSIGTKHSEKPEKFYSMLLKSTPEPRIDIFARKRHIGFDAWGDQVEDEKVGIESYL